ncbi:MAG: Mrp/NBP35 family ATP-binding protein [Pseudomonadota bacterium]
MKRLFSGLTAPTSEPSGEAVGIYEDARTTPDEVIKADVVRRLEPLIDPLTKKPLTKTGILSEPSIADGRLSLVLSVSANDVDAYQPLRAEVERALKPVEGIERVFVVLTAQAKATRSEGPSRVAPAPSAAQKTAKRPVPLPPRSQRLGGINFSGIGEIVAIASGKGGVGKSTTTANLAVSLAGQGLKVGVLDADVYGPSMPRLFGIAQTPSFDENKNATPPMRHGVKVMSMGFLVGEETPMIWRAPMVVSALKQLLSEVAWAPLDILLIDMPPGTGDTQLTISQQVPLSGTVIVSTPQDLALIDARKGAAMFQKVEVPILGLIENMSTYICPSCGHEAHIFGHGGAAEDAARIGVPFLGGVPLHIDIRLTSDAGEPIAISAPQSPEAAAYTAIARRIWGDVVARKQGRRAPPQIIIEDELETL